MLECGGGIYTYIFIYIYIYIYSCICIRICIYTHIYIHTYIDIDICIYVSKHVYIFIYIYIYIFQSILLYYITSDYIILYYIILSTCLRPSRHRAQPENSRTRDAKSSKIGVLEAPGGGLDAIVIPRVAQSTKREANLDSLTALWLPSGPLWAPFLEPWPPNGHPKSIFGDILVGLL